jgi:hypothetical protein
VPDTGTRVVRATGRSSDAFRRFRRCSAGDAAHSGRVTQGFDVAARRDGTGSEELFQDINGQLCEAGVAASSPFRSGAKPQYGLSDREVQKVGETVDDVLPSASAALARGDISFVEEELGELLDLFRINLDRSSAAYRRLGMQVLRRWVQALQATEKRHKGEVVETPEIIEPTHDEPATAGTLSAALDGWKKAKQPTPTTGNEFDHAVRRFTELHGDLPIADITRRHVRESNGKDHADHSQVPVARDR